jgi:hypothetical protein
MPSRSVRASIAKQVSDAWRLTAGAGMTNPLTEISWYSAFWAGDPAWSAPADGAAVSSWRNGGTLATSGAYLSLSGLTLPGVAGNYASVPDAAALDITSDITLVCRAAFTDWTPAAHQTLLGKWEGTGAYLFRLLTTGRLRIDWVDSGGTPISAQSTANPTVSDGATLWCAVTLDVDNGAAGNDVKFWTSTDGVTWTQLGTTVTTAGTTSIRATTEVLSFGAYGAAGASLPSTGTFSVARVYSGSGFSAAGPSGSLVLDADFRVSGNPTTFTASTGQTVTRYSTFSANQSTGASQPTFRSANSVLNNRPVVDFDGTDDRLEITTGVALAQPFSVVWIGTHDAVSSNYNMVGTNSNQNTVGLRLIDSGAGAYRHSLRFGTSVNGTVLPTINTGYMNRGYANGASSVLSVNGTQQASGDGGALAVDQIILGAGRAAPSTYGLPFDGKTAFVGIYSGDITTHPSWPAFKTWAAAHYGIVIA